MRDGCHVRLMCHSRLTAIRGGVHLCHRREPNSGGSGRLDRRRPRALDREPLLG